MDAARVGKTGPVMVRLRQILDTLRYRLLFLPVLFVVGGIVLAQSMLWIDHVGVDPLVNVIGTAG